MLMNVCIGCMGSIEMDNVKLVFWLACISMLLIGVAGGMAFSETKHYNLNATKPNEQTLNAYATFESTCNYRGYDRSECLLIWSGR